jgi:uncharacterized protein (TIGR03437 family)
VYCDRGFVAKLDPTGTRVIFSTIVSSSSRIDSVALSSEGTLYVSGVANQNGFWLTPSAWGVDQNEPGYVAAFDGSDGRLLASTRIPGGLPLALGFDRTGDVVVAGKTPHLFGTRIEPTKGSYQSIRSGSALPDVFVLKLNAQLSELKWSSVWGGTGEENVRALHVDAEGDITVVGETASVGDQTPFVNWYPTTPNAYRVVQNANSVFVTKLDRRGTHLHYSAMFGGSSDSAVAKTPYFAADGSTYLAGSSSSTDFPRVPERIGLDSGDLFVARLAADGSRLSFSRRFGFEGAKGNGISGIDVLANGTLLLYGTARGTSFPLTANAEDPCGGTYQIGSFMTQLSSDGGEILYSSYTRSLFLPGSGGVFYRFAPLAYDGELFRQTFGDPPMPGIRCVANAASLDQTSMASGMMFVVKGVNVGSAIPQIGRGRNTSLGGTQILVEGRACTILYTSSQQINAIFPFDVYGSNRAVVLEVFSGGRLVGKVSQNLVASQPGIFTLDGSGRGPAAALNEDGSLNRADNRARAGSVVSIFATGTGERVEFDSAGNIASGPGGALRYPVSVVFYTDELKGAWAEVLYAGDAPGNVIGLVQINARIPARFQNRGAVQVWLSQERISSSSRIDPPVTIWVE